MATETPVTTADAAVPLRGRADAVSRAGRADRRASVTVTVAFGLLLTMWALLTPLFQAPDEAAHFDSAAHLALGDGWAAPGAQRYLDATHVAQQSVNHVPHDDRPTFGQLMRDHPGSFDYVDQMTQHPPTYYAVGAVVLRLVHFTSVRWDIGVLALRMLDVLLVTPLPLLAWAAVRRLTRSPRAALVAALAVFAVPQVAQIGSSVTNDAPVMLLSAVLTWLVVRLFTGSTGRWSLLSVAVVLGLLVATKGTGLPAVPFVAVAVVLAVGRGRGAGVGGRWLSALGVMVVAGVVGGWFWARNIVVFHTVQPNGLSSARPDVPWVNGATRNVGVFFNTEWNGLTQTFWGDFGPAAFPMAPFLTDTLSVVAIGAVVVWGFRRGPELRAVIALTILPVLLIASQMLTSWQEYGHTQGIFGVQGRYFFPALVALLCLSAVAWRRAVLTADGRRRVGGAFSVAAVVVALYGLTVAYRGYFEKFHLLVTGIGLHRLTEESPLGVPGVVAVAALLVLALAVTWWAARVVLADRGTGATPTAEGRIA
jgi:hypothetical protein